MVKNGLGHFCYIVLYLPPKPSGRGEATPWRKTLDAICKWTDGLLMSLPTRCFSVLIDWDDRAPMNHLISSVLWVLVAKERAPHGSELFYDVIFLQCHPPSAWRLPLSMGGRSRIDFVATPPTVQYSRVFVNFTAGRRLQLIPSTCPHDNMPLTLDLVTTGLRHCPDPTCGPWDHEKIEDVLADPISRLTFFQELETKIRTSTVVGRAATRCLANSCSDHSGDSKSLLQEAPRPSATRSGTSPPTTGT